MKTASLIKKHNECARLLSEIEKESNPECLALLYELYANALIAIVLGPIEKVFNVERTVISDKPIRQINIGDDGRVTMIQTAL